MKILFFFFFVTFIASAYAQIIDSRICDNNSHPIITGYVRLLKTKSVVSFDSLLRSKQSLPFSEIANKPVIYSGYDSYYYWFRLVILNDDSIEKNLMLLLGPTGLNDSELYQVHNGKWTFLGKTGHKNRFNTRPYPYMHYIYPLQLQPKTIDTFYLQMGAAHIYKSYGFALLQTKTLAAFANRLYFFFGIIIGLLSLFLVFNLYLYFTIRDRVHLWYAFYIGLLILIVMKNDHLDEEFLHFDSESVYRMTSVLAMAALAIGVLMHVVQLYVQGIPPKSLLFKATRLVKWNLLLSAGIQFMVFYLKSDTAIETLVFYWADISTITGILFIVINCIYGVYKGFKPALFILTGLLIFLLGSMQRLLFFSNLSYMFPPSLLHVGMVLETMIISFGFIFRYRIDRDQKEKLQKNFQQELHKSQLEIQEQIFENISLELHDNIGQVLSLAKLHLKTIDFNNPKEVQAKINDGSQLISEAIQRLRDLSKGLSTDFVSELGLLKSIDYALLMINKGADCKAVLVIEGDYYLLSPETELILFRVFQELLNNIIKHAGASHIIVTLYYNQNNFILQVNDNGQGFHLNSLQKNDIEKMGLGIRNMQNRSRLLGANLIMESKIGEGTTVKIILPRQQNGKAG